MNFPRRNQSIFSDESVYPVRFTGSSLVGVDGLMFEGGSGILGMETIQVVAIENCEFRYVWFINRWACLIVCGSNSDDVIDS